MDTKPKLDKLLSPISIGGMEVRNRLVMPPMGVLANDAGGFVSDRGIAYYEARARGGTGLVIVEYTCVDYPRGQAADLQLAIADDKYIPGLRRLAEAIRRHGARAAIQIHHAGRAADSRVTGMQPIAPSPIPMPVSTFGKPQQGDLPHALSKGEIAEVVALFAQAARRAKEAGFDGVEFHAASGYLIAEFLSRAANKRTDEYGGEISNRARFLQEIIRACKREVGRDFPVWPRINGREYGIEDGLTSAEAAEIAKLAQDAGADAIHVSTFVYGTSPRSVPPMSIPPGSLMRLVDAIKPAVTVPVIAVGNMNLQFGEQILQEGRADLIAIGKGLIADPSWATRRGRGG